MVIRPSHVDEAPAVAALITLAYRVEDFFVSGDRTDATDVRRRMQRGEFLVLEDPPGVLAGSVYVERRNDRGYFGMLSVDPARQGHGLGRALVDAAEARCLAAGCHEMEIEVVNLRTELPAFYRRLGYVEESTRPFPTDERVSRPVHYIVMTKPLASISPSRASG
jgi:GNAT superfamily N-acetyltransferase